MNRSSFGLRLPAARSPEPSFAGSLLVNLAGTPFVNRRPVQRFTMAAWVVGALLAGINVLLWVQYRHDSTALRGRLTETRAQIEERSANVVRMNGELGGLGLAAQNEQIEFLNQRIAERTFPWSLLFERIAATMPNGVRLLGLNPVFQDRGRRGASEATAALPEEELVDLKIRGVAKSDEDLYQWIDAFFASPAFERPRLYQESRTLNEVHFTVDVQYRPRLEPEGSHRPAAADEPLPEASEDDVLEGEPLDDGAAEEESLDGEGGGQNDDRSEASPVLRSGGTTR